MIRSQGRQLQSRRATAVMVWTSMVLLALLLWRSRAGGDLHTSAWEPAVLVLSAFLTFLSLFGWLLFWPDRSTTEESPLLFLAGLLTLTPPCVIAWLLMPPGSELRPWLSLALLIFGILTMLSPIPPELFRVPRERRHWLHLVTDASLSMLDVEPPRVSFEQVQPQTQYRLTGSPERSQPEAATADRGRVRERDTDVGEPTRDPWEDPFRGTGRRLSRVREVAAPAVAGNTPAAATRHAVATAALPGMIPAAVPKVPPPVPEQRELMEAETKSGLVSVGGVEDDGSDAGLISEIISIERTADEFGGVMVEGVARAVFRTGQKRVNLQIPLSPPLPGIPEAECEPVGHEPLRARVALRQPYGLRIEVRRTEASEALEADIGFSAVCTPSRPG